MALKIVNTESLDAVANALNEAAGKSGKLLFPDEYISTVKGLSAGGGEDLSAALTEQEALVAELKSLLALKAMGDENPLAQFAEGTITELNPTNLAGCTAIGDYTFYYNQKITNVCLPNTVKSVGSRVFDTAVLTRLSFEEGTNITFAEDAFYNVGKLQEVTFPSSQTTLSKGIFRSCYELASVILSENITYISPNAFKNCSKLTTLHIPSATIWFGDSAFYAASNITEITLAEGCVIKNISQYAFQRCSKLISMPLSNSTISNIAVGTFYSCSSLKNIAIPKTVTAIWDNAFYGCTALEYIDLTAYGTDGTFPQLGKANAFQNCGTSTASGTFEIRVKSGRKSELAAMTNWSTYADNIVEV